MSNSDSRFMRDDELRVLLNKWNAPEAPGSLDQRIAASYRQSMSDVGDRLSSLDPQWDSEVVKMKFCNTCQEQFADRFSFCPVDGTPLSVAPPPPPVTPRVTSAPDVEASYPISETPRVAAPPTRPVQPAAVVPAAIQTTPAQPSGFVSASAWPPAVVPKIVVPVRAGSRTAVPHEMIGEYHLTMLEDKGLAPRLADALGEVAHNY